MTVNLKALLASQGFIVLPSVLNPTQISSLRTACTTVRSLAERGQWPHLRTLPKQFPPWSSDPSHGIWGIQHLLHPDMPHQSRFAASYFNDTIIDTVKQLLECEEKDLIMELYNLLIRPSSNFELRWHRDDIPPSASAEEEEKRLQEPAWHAQWNLALYDDRSLVVVPGSHRRARTDREREADAYEKDMPGQLVVELKAGDVVFYDNNIFIVGSTIAIRRGLRYMEVLGMWLEGTRGRETCCSMGRLSGSKGVDLGTWKRVRGKGQR